MKTLEQYIKDNHAGNKSAFARSMHVNRQEITTWIKSGWIVASGRLYSPKRKIKTGSENV